MNGNRLPTEAGSARASPTSGLIDLSERLERSLERWREPGAAELCALLREMVGDAADGS